MILKHFNIQIIIRTILLSLSIFLFLYIVEYSDQYAILFIIGIFIIYQVYALIRLMNKTNQKLTQFLAAIRYADFSQSFRTQFKDDSFKELSQAFSVVIAEFQRIRGEKEESLKYLQTVVQHIGIALLVYDQSGKIELINTAAKKLLNARQIGNIQSLQNFSPELVQILMTTAPRKRHILRIQVDESIMQLVVFTNEFRLKRSHLTIASIQNIQSELEEKEMEAWQKLIRVLTHEIMNSITPISSLAKTVDEMLLQDKNQIEDQFDSQEFKDIREAVNTIQKRSEGLIHFVEAYRKLTRIPQPLFKTIEINATIDHVLKLMDRELRDQEIQVHNALSKAKLTILADPEQIEHVLINLLNNAIDALGKVKHKEIHIRSMLDEQGRKVIEIIDNGSGITPEARDQIFIPFFTTKPSGSGIGLSLCRQIMRQHSGSISVSSIPKKMTSFKLTFP